MKKRKGKVAIEDKKPLTPFFFYMQIRRAEMRDNGVTEALYLQMKKDHKTEQESKMQANKQIIREISKEWKSLTKEQKRRFDIPGDIQKELRVEGKFYDTASLRRVVLANEPPSNDVSLAGELTNLDISEQ